MHAPSRANCRSSMAICGQSLRDSDSKFARWTLMGLTAP